MKERFSQKAICSGVSKTCGGIRIVATLRYGDVASSQATVGSSTGIATGSVWTWTRKSKRASRDARWEDRASRSLSFEREGGGGGTSVRSGRQEYRTASRPRR